jgi:isopenicillin N synthase-like dioxygenase
VGDGVYKSVRPVTNMLVVNLGDMFSRITNYTLKATLHRVLDIGVERFSSPFFFEPHYTTEIPTVL